jgi:hypothetical protein
LLPPLSLDCPWVYIGVSLVFNCPIMFFLTQFVFSPSHGLMKWQNPIPLSIN